MSNRSEYVFSDARSNLRVKDNSNITWKINETELKGEGKIVNISSTGMLFETRSLSGLDDQSIFSFDSNYDDANYLPETGRLVWHKEKKFPRNRLFCGVEFVNPSTDKLSRLRDRIQRGITAFINARKLNIISGLILFILSIILFVYVLWTGIGIYSNVTRSNEKMLTIANDQSYLVQDYSQAYQANKVKLDDVTNQLSSKTTELVTTQNLFDESQQMLSSVSRDLEATKAILIQTENMLTSVRQDNKGLKNDIQFEKNNFLTANSGMSSQIAALQEKNIELMKEMKLIEEKIKYYEGNIRIIFNT